MMTTNITKDERAMLSEDLIILHKRSGECMDDVDDFVNAYGIASLVDRLNDVIDGRERIELLERLFWAHLEKNLNARARDLERERIELLERLFWAHLN